MADIGMPARLEHGALDANVPIGLLEAMDKARRLVVVPDGDHSLMKTSQRETLLKEIVTVRDAHPGTDSTQSH